MFQFLNTTAHNQIAEKYHNSLKNDTSRGSLFWKAPTYSKLFGPPQLGLQAKVSTFFSGSENLNF